MLGWCILADEIRQDRADRPLSTLCAANRCTCPAHVAPTTLLYNWQSEIERFAPGLRATVITGSRALREKTLEEALHDEGKDVIITSYPLLRQDIALYEKIRFRFAVLDEAQNIKNFTSQTARTAKRLNAHTRLALTGTPMENNITELWSLFDLYCLISVFRP